MKMKDIVEELVTQQIRIFEILDFDERPLARSPAATSQLKIFSRWCLAKGFTPPPSYKEFLRVCNGIENASTRLYFGCSSSPDLLCLLAPEPRKSRMLFQLRCAANAVSMDLFDKER